MLVSCRHGLEGCTGGVPISVSCFLVSRRADPIPRAWSLIVSRQACQSNSWSTSCDLLGSAWSSDPAGFCVGLAEQVRSGLREVSGNVEREKDCQLHFIIVMVLLADTERDSLDGSNCTTVRRRPGDSGPAHRSQGRSCGDITSVEKREDKRIEWMRCAP